MILWTQFKKGIVVMAISRKLVCMKNMNMPDLEMVINDAALWKENWIHTQPAWLILSGIGCWSFILTKLLHSLACSDIGDDTSYFVLKV